MNFIQTREQAQVELKQLNELMGTIEQRYNEIAAAPDYIGRQTQLEDLNIDADVYSSRILELEAFLKEG